MTPYPLPDGEEGKRFVREYLEDLVADFPFADAASRQNLFGLLLTPIVRPALDGNVPVHLAEAALERTGKTKLLEHVVGGKMCIRDKRRTTGQALRPTFGGVPRSVTGNSCTRRATLSSWRSSTHR